MKIKFLILALIITSSSKAQIHQIDSIEDYSEQFIHIQHGDLPHFLSPKVRVAVEKKRGRWIISEYDPDQAYKIFLKHSKNRELVHDKRLEGLQIYAWPKDEKQKLKKITLGFDRSSNKITSIEISNAD